MRTFAWSIPLNQPLGSYYMRIKSNQGSLTSDLSNTTFTIASSGIHYYVNDNSTAGDLLTTAVGNNLNSGKSPSEPMQASKRSWLLIPLVLAT